VQDEKNRIMSQLILANFLKDSSDPDDKALLDRVKAELVSTAFRPPMKRPKIEPISTSAATPGGNYVTPEPDGAGLENEDPSCKPTDAVQSLCGYLSTSDESDN